MAVEASKASSSAKKQWWVAGSIGGFSLMLFACVLAATANDK